jgi:hypothetical protein
VIICENAIKFYYLLEDKLLHLFPLQMKFYADDDYDYYNNNNNNNNNIDITLVKVK